MNAILPTSAFSQAPSRYAQSSVVTLTQPSPRITINDVGGMWTKDLTARLEELIRLQPGWDGYNGRPVALANAIFALGMLNRLYSSAIPAPDIVPGYTGDLQAEWHVGDVDIELHVKAPNSVVAWRSTPDAGEDGEELVLQNDFTILGTWIEQLADKINAVAAAVA